MRQSGAPMVTYIDARHFEKRGAKLTALANGKSVHRNQVCEVTYQSHQQRPMGRGTKLFSALAVETASVSTLSMNGRKGMARRPRTTPHVSFDR